MGFWDYLRSLAGGARPAESPRRLAFEVTLQAADLAGEGAPRSLQQRSTPEMLQDTRRLLAGLAERRQDDTRRAEALRVEAARLRAENAALRERLAMPGRPSADLGPGPDADPGDGAGSEPTPLVHDLIDIADRIAGLGDRLEPAVTRWLLDRITGVLADAGVTPIRDEGVVDPGRHAVLDVRPAADPGLAGRIAETVRPGYRWGRQILRPQQVIAYVEGGR
ncbi:MAG TPA: hypothetical protein VHJ17_03955 [Thermomonospora sp.]|nr:hypothetical protein [Thermomonospora sp.]